MTVRCGFADWPISQEIYTFMPFALRPLLQGLRRERFVLETIHAMQACRKSAIARTRSLPQARDETRALPRLATSNVGKH